MTQRSTFLVALCLMAAGCDMCTPPGEDAGPPGSTSGTLVIDGEDQLYSVDPEQTQLIILNKLNEGVFGCGVFHSHAIEALAYTAEFTMDQSDPAGSTWTFEVPAQGLDPDDPANRARFEQTRDQELSEGDRARVKVSVLEELRADEHPTLVFAARDFTTFEGAGEAVLDVTLNGITSEVPFTYTSTLNDDDTLTITAAGTIDGTPHAIPNPDGAFSACISAEMPLILEMTLRPGGGDGPGPVVDAGPPYEETFFPWDDGCPDTGGFDEVQEIFMRRCVGCHMEPTRLGASVPLVEWEDFRVDTARNPGQPLYTAVEELISLPADASLHMPPEELQQLTTDEFNAVLDWTSAGGPPENCQPTPLVTFTHVPQSMVCGTYGWEEDIKQIFDDNSCVSCHSSDQSELPAFGSVVNFEPQTSYTAGLELGEHPFFQPLNLFEAGVERMRAGSMPPPEFGAVPTADVTILETWISEGYPETKCP